MSDIEKTPEILENQTNRTSTPPLESEEKKTDEVVKRLPSKEKSSGKKKTRSSSSNNEVEENDEKEEINQEGKDKEKRVSKERLLSFMFKRKTNEKTTVSESPKKSHKDKKKEGGEEEEENPKRKVFKKNKKQQMLKQSKSEIITKKSEEIDSQELIIEHHGDDIIDSSSQKENEEKTKRKEGSKERPKSLKEKLSPRKESKEEKKVKDTKKKKEVIDKEQHAEERHKNDIWKRKTVCTMERREKRRSSEISIKKEKKNIEVTVEIGFLLQTYNKTFKVASQMKVREVIEKTMISIKEGLHDDVVVYQSNGEVVNQEEDIGAIATNNKAYIYVSKRGRKCAKKIIFEFETEKKKEEKKGKEQADPQVVYDLCRWIYMHGIEVEGIFRISGNNEYIKKLIEKVIKHSTGFLDEMNHGVNDVHNVVGVLKSYLREATVGLFDLQIAEEILKNEENKREEVLMEIIEKLNKKDKYTLCIILNLAEAIIQYKDVNQMGIGNIAVVLGPMLIHSNGAVSLIGTQTQLELAVLLINLAQSIRKRLDIDTFFSIDEVVSKFETPTEFIHDNEEPDRFVYDISCLDEETQKLAQDICGWMEVVLDSDNNEEAIHWIQVYYEENEEHFVYIVNMLTPDFVISQTYQGTYSTTQQYPSSQKEQILNQIEVNIFDLHPPAVPAWELSEQRLPQPPSFELQKKWYFPIIQSIKPQQFSQIIAWFNQVDKDHSGTLEIDEISTGSYPGCIRLSPQTALRFMRIFDTSRTGHLNIYEFIAIYRYLEICYALFNAYNGSGPEIIKSRLTGLGFVGTTQCTVDILSKIFSYNNVMDLNNWVACGAFVLQSRAIYQDLLDQGLMQKTENPQDATKILDSITLLIDK
ncbi:RhoGAP domain containing protein [Entamoeba histolytica HM-1:IMSS-B]|uniref:RhoGAP domain containing protein n=1 Tax=Entamoeba histolytica HM-1:IMSS-B TaxID=885319 RepID=M3UWV1_ENTH1|nr:RhoGAP domain containing protein [Entamoeba histolytica HM-1:IMSS-B]